MRSEAIMNALNPRGTQEITLAALKLHRHSSMLGCCTCGGAEYDDSGPYDAEMAEHEKHQAGIVSADLIRLNIAVEAIEVDALRAEIVRTLGAHRRLVGPTQCSCGVRYDETDLFEAGRDEHDGHAAAVIAGQLQVRGMVESDEGVQLASEAVLAAIKAMETVTPPPGISKTDWLHAWGRNALIAGAAAAAVRATVLLESGSKGAAEAAARALLKPHQLVYPHAASGLRLSCTCDAPLDDCDPMTMTPMERHGIHLASVIAAAGWRPMIAGDTENVVAASESRARS